MQPSDIPLDRKRSMIDVVNVNVTTEEAILHSFIIRPLYGCEFPRLASGGGIAIVISSL
eukprot:CAMPEP_0204821882 /NCGR_PEP_ID=MMETSP1346-20131115/87_1 /ASSEMBLY_ACC=CAM_ASM_000771 /TAXON_ID=215587 /ORGANISM="Aplanochytrium stocchinoi, Strain GSBS06" /LENGTH=58 /DNA_ID=CAMNT_0051947841 /DNA_START=1853 /DNA_END=2029 /DNA_ORIENTATION=+